MFFVWFLLRPLETRSKSILSCSVLSLRLDLLQTGSYVSDSCEQYVYEKGLGLRKYIKKLITF